MQVFVFVQTHISLILNIVNCVQLTVYVRWRAGVIHVLMAILYSEALVFNVHNHREYMVAVVDVVLEHKEQFYLVPIVFLFQIITHSYFQEDVF
jgi:hypothetical protein